MKKILITGATGLIGREIVKICHDQNLIVHYLTTSKKNLVTKIIIKAFIGILIKIRLMKPALKVLPL